MRTRSTPVSNTDKTITTKRLKQQQMLTSGNIRPHSHTGSGNVGNLTHDLALISEKLNRSVLLGDCNTNDTDVRNLVLQLRNISDNLQQKLDKNSEAQRLVKSRANRYYSQYMKESDMESGFSDESDPELKELIARVDLENIYAKNKSLAGRPQSSHKAQWFTKPVHLIRSKDEKEFETFRSLGLPTRSISPVGRKEGVVGAAIAADQVAAQVEHLAGPTTRDLHQSHYDRHKEYFPATLGYSKSIEQIRSLSSPRPTVTPKPDHLKDPERDWNIYGTLRKGSPKYKPLTKKLMKNYPIENSHIMADKAPATAHSTTGLPIVTPFQLELGKLRMERLRIEEERLLEMKRVEELERIRGPKPKWYESKKTDFYYESHKNTNLIRNQKDWQDIFDYQSELLNSSQEFKKSREQYN